MGGQTEKFTERQKEILTEALRILAEEGSRALTMKRVAQGIGFTEAAVYRHFESKRAMLSALYAFVRQSLLETLSPILARDVPPPERLALFLEQTVLFLLENKGVNLVLLAESIQQKDVVLREAMWRIFSEFKALVEALLRIGMSTGDFRGDLDPDAVATCIAGSIQGMLTRYILAGSNASAFDPLKARPALVSFVLNAVGSPDASRNGLSNEK